ncbi:hypothetical protein EW093_08995 [Thiospirochaeta perfilievii]|uniref:Uncharacterized protein n=1 Tax=Thiospirochaeta perfilievii TaxID=252967 RepID=A0A5C1Q9M6_9SPIO|nr:hypothetical protein [Thiospirochaeta perfilievii]QEN04833.1 hypothetical protein EW093_08995 [Thiospirochaeta perfilievii]
MDQCEFLDICSFAKDGNDTELKASYCDSNPLRCARFMVYQSLGAEKVPEDLMPDQKTDAYGIIAEN